MARWQADFVAARLRELYPSLKVVLRIITTKGDKILDVPLAKIGGKGLFTKELEEAMLEGEIDLAVHSLKDVPTKLPKGLKIAAITKREEPFDAFVSRSGQKLKELPRGARIGTSSLRRRAQLLNFRPDLQIADLRGNVNTRLKRLDEGDFDAVVLAAAGLYRLGRGDMITEILSPKILLPAVGQGALAVETRDDDALSAKLRPLQDEATLAAAESERAFLATVEGGCQVPVGVYATTAADNLTVEAVIASVDGQRAIRRQIIGDAAKAKELGQDLAEEMLAAGGREILRELGL